MRASELEGKWRAALHRMVGNLRGTSLIEQMLFLALSSIILSGVISFYISHYEVNLGQEQVAEMQQNVRIALDRVSQEVLMGGYGVPQQAGIVAASENGITFLNRLDKAYTTLSAALSAAATSLSVDSAAGFSVNDVIYLLHPDGSVESPSPKVTVVNLSTNTLTVESGVSKAYPVGSSVSSPSNYTTMTSSTAGSSLSVASVANFKAGDAVYVVHPTNGTFVSKTVDSINSSINQLTLQSSLGTNYPTGSFVVLPVAYALEGSTSAPRLVRKVGGVSQVLADDVESLRFTYYDSADPPQTIPNPLPSPYDSDPFTEETVLSATDRNAIVRAEIRLAIRTHKV
ncbi:MAG: PilW family protein, partial [Dehalococcoidia bacterium]